MQDANSYQLAYQIGCTFITFTNLLPVAFHTIAIVLENALRFELLYAFFANFAFLVLLEEIKSYIFLLPFCTTR